MKKLFTSMLCVFIAIPLLLTVWGFALPAQYSNTFVGELPAKRALLAAESDKPRLILVGGSAAAFGVDSALLARELPDYQPVNFGLYAALGTRVMLDLSIKELRPGDLVVIMPEQQRQALSDTVGADTFWQAVDGDFSALACTRGILDLCWGRFRALQVRSSAIFSPVRLPRTASIAAAPSMRWAMW